MEKTDTAICLKRKKEILNIIKQRLKEYQKNYREAKNSQYNN